MKKTVGLITSEESFLNNYGAVLQGYALFNTINELGYDCSIIRYLGAVNKINTNRILGNFRYFRLNKMNVFHLFKYIRDRKKRGIRLSLFKKFTDEHLSFYNNDIGNYKKLKNNPPELDMFVCGSDQIWNPKIKGNINDRGYFLDFVPKGKKRIAYAPSIGINAVPEACKEEMRFLLTGMDYLSVREQSGADIIKDLTGIDVPVLLDPTMLPDKKHWELLAAMPKDVQGDYILVYTFGNIEHTRSCIDKLKKKLKLPVVTLPLVPVALKGNYKRCYFAGPREFLGLIKNAKLVCTDSFHATVFSIIFNTPFYTFLREIPKENEQTMNSRMENLLQSLGLKERMLLPDSALPETEHLRLDFSRAKFVIQQRKEESLAYFKKALDE